MSHGTDFAARVAERARVPEADAKPLVKSFLAALSGIVDRETWNLIRALVPDDIEMTWEDGADYESSTVEQFLLDQSNREPVRTDRAAEHARAVAGAVRERATDEELRQLVSLVQNDDILALFEEERGELTAPDSPTKGAKAIHSPAQSRPHREDDRPSE